MVPPGKYAWDRTGHLHEGPTVLRRVQRRPPHTAYAVTGGLEASRFSVNAEKATERAVQVW